MQDNSRCKDNSKRISRNSLISIGNGPCLDFTILNPLNYQKSCSVRYHNRSQKIHEQTDTQFLENIRKIKGRQNIFSQLKQKIECEWSEKQYEQLHYYARIHQKANILNQNSDKKFSQISKSQQCGCGCGRGKGKMLGIGVDQQRLFFLGPGVILQFFLIKSIAKMVLLVFLIYGVFGIVTNAIGGQALMNEHCTQDWYCQFKTIVSDQNKQRNVVFYQVQDWLGFVFCFLWILLLRIIKYVGKQKNQMIDSELSSPSDLAVKISNLPYGSYEQTQLISYLQQLWSRKRKQLHQKSQLYGRLKLKSYQKRALQLQKLQLQSIHIIYDMSTIRKILQNFFNTLDRLLQYFNCSYNDTENIKDKNLLIDRDGYLSAKHDLITLYETLLDFRKRFLNDPLFRKRLSSTCCILGFKRDQDQRVFVQNVGVERVGLQKKIKMKIEDLLSNGNNKILFKGKIIKIERAPEPSDIIWTNCQKSESVLRKVLIYLLSLVCILISFGIQLGIQSLQQYILEQTTPQQMTTMVSLINFVKSLVLLLLNHIFWIGMTYLLDIQYNHTLTEKIISKMNKVIVLSIVNSIVLPILILYWARGKNKDFVYGNHGLAGLCFEFHVSGFVGVLKALFNVGIIGKIVLVYVRVFRHWVVKYVSDKQKVHKNKSQYRGDPSLNQFYQGCSFDVAQNYVFMIICLFHAVFFCKLQPILLLLSTITTGTFFLVNKIMLFRFCKIPEMTQFLVFDTATYVLGFLPIVYGVGSIVMSIFQNQVYGNQNIYLLPEIITIVVGIIGVLNPKDIFNKMISELFRRFDIDLEAIFGAYNNDQIVQDNSQPTNQQPSSNESSGGCDIQPRRKNRQESYYANSNLLDLLGFENKIKRQQHGHIKLELQSYCQSYFQTFDADSHAEIIGKLSLPVLKIAHVPGGGDKAKGGKKRRRKNGDKQNQENMSNGFENSGQELLKNQNRNKIINAQQL